MGKYKLSIIVPTFNLEDEIEKTFNSIKSQNIGFDNIEVIFVDDMSTDNTLNILNNYSDSFNNVKVYSTDKNSGYAGKPRNIGLEKSTSDHVLFLDGDDQLLVNACKVLYDEIKLSQADIIIGGQINVFSDETFEFNPPVFFNEECHFTDMENPNLLLIRPAISAKLFNKSVLTHNNINFNENIPAQDLLFLLEVILNSHEVITLNSCYIYYRNLNDNSVTFRLDEDYFYGLIKAYGLVCDLFEKYDVDKEIQGIVLHNHLSFFTERVLSAYYSDDMEVDFEEIFNSEIFDELSCKNIFINNPNFDLYFKRMKNKEYNNRDLLNTIYQTFNFDSKIISDLKYVKDEISKLNIKPQKILENNKYLRKTNEDLIKENKSLSDELNEIKSSKLWKLKNKF